MTDPANAKDREPSLPEAAIDDPSQVDLEAMTNALRSADVARSAGDATRIAEVLGLDRPAVVNIDGRRVAASRKSEDLKLSEFVAALDRAGADVNRQECLRWETNPSVQVARHTAIAIGAVLDLPVEHFETSSVELSAAQRFLNSDQFDSMIAEWCAEHERDATVTRVEVERQMVSAGYRADDVTNEQMAAVIRAILDRLV